MENDASDRFQGDEFQDEGSIAEDQEVQPSLLNDITQTDIRNTSLPDDSSKDHQQREKEIRISQEKAAKDDMYKNTMDEEEANYVDAWNLSLEHANATYQSSTSFTSSMMDSERSDLHLQSNASERLHQQLQRQSLLSDESKKNQLLQSDAEQSQSGTTLPPPNQNEGRLLDLEQPSTIPIGGRTISSSASTKPPPPPVLNRRSNYRQSQPGAVAMVGHHLQANLPAGTLDDQTVQIGASEHEEDDERKAASPLVDAVLVSDEVEAPTTSPQVAATTAVLVDDDSLPRWGLRDRRILCLICALVCIIAGLAAGLSFVFLQNQEDDPILTKSPTIAPTFEPVPTVSPTSRIALLQALLSKYISDVTPWENVTSAQYQALDWLANKDTWRPVDTGNLDTEGAIVERYAVLTIFFSLDGPNWSEDESYFDLSRTVCSWQEEYCHSFRECEINGVLCDENFVTGLVLGEVDVVGTIPTEVGLLSSLSSFAVTNTTLQGSLPSELFLLPELNSVLITDCVLTGTLPSTILQAPSLSWLHLRGNSIEGTIENAANPGLLELDLGSNQFTGPLPISLSKELFYLDVGNNAGLTGTIPNIYSKLSLTNLFVEGTSLTNVESVFCGTGLLDYEEFYADCGGSRPRVLCRCCTHCCDEKNCFPN